jgi:hypothetical protein
MTLKELKILSIAVMLLAATASAMGSSDSVVLDIIGSEADTAEITASGWGDIEVDIIGSETRNITILPPQTAVVISSCCDYCYPNVWMDFARPLCYPYSSYIPTRYYRSFVHSPCGYCGQFQPEHTIITTGGRANVLMGK